MVRYLGLFLELFLNTDQMPRWGGGVLGGGGFRPEESLQIFLPGINLAASPPKIMRGGFHLLIAGILFFPGGAFAGDVVFRSGPGHVHLLELFTSEGCSSCPPAEKRLSGLAGDPGLWKDVVPVAFHVDYWDNLGWPDRFASPAYTQRQQRYAQEWGGDSVYTPEFVLDGREFRAAEIPAPSGSGGNLSVTLNSTRQLTVRYEPGAPNPGAEWEVHVATLGMGLVTDVRAGENGGRRLRQDFVALALVSLPLHAGANTATLTLPTQKDGEKAIAVWITQANESAPVQAAGGWE